MSSDEVRKILYGLEPRESSNSNVPDKFVTDGYVPKANGISVVERIRNMSSKTKQNITYSR